MLIRIDFASPLASPRRLANGNTIYTARAATLDKMTYVQPDGSTRQEFRQRPELARIADGIRGCRVTNDHPSGFDDWSNIVGVVTAAKVAGDAVDVDLEIWDPTAQRAIASGAMSDVSMGYETDLVEHGDGLGEQTNIQVDHLAIVPRGRCTTCHVQRDRADAQNTCKCTSCSCGKSTDVSQNQDGLDDEATAKAKMRRATLDAWQKPCVGAYTKQMALSADRVQR